MPKELLQLAKRMNIAILEAVHGTLKTTTPPLYKCSPLAFLHISPWMKAMEEDE